MTEHLLADRVTALLEPPGTPEEALRRAAREASPAAKVSRGDPPVLLIHGLDDQLVSSTQAEALSEVLRSKGVDVDLHLIPGHGHIWNGAETMSPTVFDWLKRHEATRR